MKYDIIGDIHGCFDEFCNLVDSLGYRWTEEKIPIHPNDRTLVFLGDLTDRGPNSLAVMQTVSKLVEKGKAHYTPGNHCMKLYRYLIGRNVQVTHGLETTVAELASLTKRDYEYMSNQFIALVEQAPLYLVLDDRNLIVAHAGIKRNWIGQENGKIKAFVLYGDITGEKEEDGRPIRRDWALTEHGEEWIVYGHTPVLSPRILNNTANIDTGCIFGGKLTAFRYPELATISVPSKQPFLREKFRTFN